ncbi:MAG TPA: hypothetical protein VGE94_15595 [Chloroflexota bacterium]|jgi:hypothetical protein
MTEEDERLVRWALYAPRLGSHGWILQGIYPTQIDAQRWGRALRPRVIVAVRLPGRPPSRFNDEDALQHFFRVS